MFTKINGDLDYLAVFLTIVVAVWLGKTLWEFIKR
jgi:hypothetical protein